VGISFLLNYKYINFSSYRNFFFSHLGFYEFFFWVDFGQEEESLDESKGKTSREEELGEGRVNETVKEILSDVEI